MVENRNPNLSTFVHDRERFREVFDRQKELRLVVVEVVVVQERLLDRVGLLQVEELVQVIPDVLTRQVSETLWRKNNLLLIMYSESLLMWSLIRLIG